MSEATVSEEQVLPNGKLKQQECCICHATVYNNVVVRLQKCLYGAGRTSGHYPVEHYDFCKRCYAKFEKWINKHKEEADEKNTRT